MGFAALEGITVLTDDVARLAAFFEDGLGFAVSAREEHYVAFAAGAVRLAVFRREHMRGSTGDHPSFSGPRGSQAFELNLECSSVAEVETAFRRLVEHGGTAVAPPARTTWGHFTGFFADPEGNIHSLFTDLADRTAEPAGALT